MAVNSLAQLVGHPEERVDLAGAALLLAREIRYPDLTPEPWLRQIDALAAAVRTRIAGIAPQAQIEQLSRALFAEHRFRGNSVDYYDPRNSFLNDVLERRLGIPITLTLVLVEVGRRAGLDMFGVSLPGHFLAGVVLEGERVYLDAFNHGLPVDLAGMTELVEHATGESAAFDPAWLRPVKPYQFLARMCANLQGVYILQQDWSRAVLATERLFLFTRQPDVLRDLGYLRFQAGHLVDAASAFEAYLLNAPQAEDAQSVRENMASIYSKLARLN